jgi:GAF domain-containing protein
MFETKTIPKTKPLRYEAILDDLKYLIIKKDTLMTKYANLSALLNYYLQDINWVGFYLYDGSKLTLGPFQGLPACTTIFLNAGVCGKAAHDQTTIIVKDVSKFDDHIACDMNSKSEIVVPIIKADQLVGVLDIDAPIKNRFDEVDQRYLEEIINKFIDIL